MPMSTMITSFDWWEITAQARLRRACVLYRQNNI